MSRNPHVPTAKTRQEVRLYSARWMRQREIALMLDISEKTLRFYYRDELDDGKADVIAAVIEALLKLVRAGNAAAAMFYYKCQGGRRIDEDEVWNEELSAPEKQAALRVFVDSPPADAAEQMKSYVLDALDIRHPLEAVSDAALLKAIARCRAEIAVTEDCDDVRFFSV